MLRRAPTETRIPLSAARLFFALWPDDAARARLFEFAQTLHRDCGGRLINRDNLHQTLVFLGNVAAERVPQLVALAAKVSVPPFKLEFGITGYWRHNRIVWAAPHATLTPLHTLVEGLGRGLQQAGLHLEDRPYASHVTLIRDARAPAALPLLAFDWPIRDFALVRSVHTLGGSRYEVIARAHLS